MSLTPFLILAQVLLSSPPAPSPEGVRAFLAEVPACDGRAPQCARAGGWDHIKDAKEISEAISQVARSQEEADRMAIFATREGGMDKHAVGDNGKAKGIVQLQNFSETVAFDPLKAFRAWQALSDRNACTKNPPDEMMAWAWGDCSWKIARAGARHREEMRRDVRARVDARAARAALGSL